MSCFWKKIKIMLSKDQHDFVYPTMFQHYQLHSAAFHDIDFQNKFNAF